MTNLALSDAVVAEIQAEVDAKIAANPELALGGLAASGISAASICANKALILGFLDVLVALLPGIVGKLAGQAIVVAANGWFKNRNC